MHLELITEEPSAEAALQNLLPLMLPEGATFALRPFSDKNELLSRLTDRLRGYVHWAMDDWYVVVLVDRDADDCQELKARLDVMATEAGLVPKARAMEGRFHVLNRIAVEELEAWFFGDVPALRTVHPGVPETLGLQVPYRDPDAITGGTWEKLARVLGYERDRYPKIKVAREISKHMEPGRNRSHSFNVFASGIAQLASENA